MPALSKRDQLVEHALNLFYQHGFHATGIDLIIATAQVSKKTLYNHFKSKEELIIATLEKRDRDFQAFLITGIEQRATMPIEKLTAVFDVLDLWFNQASFSGCMFINASAEYPLFNDPCHQVCSQHKKAIADYILSLAQAAKFQNAERLTKQLMLIIEGAIVEAHVNDNKQAAKEAKELALLVIGQYGLAV